MKEITGVWDDCGLVETTESGIVGYKDASCGTDTVCITINQNYGMNGEVKILNSVAWASSLAFKLRCYIGAASVD